MKNVTPPLTIVFRYQKRSETQKAPPHESYVVRQKVVDNFLWYSFLWFTKSFLPKRTSSARKIQKHQKLPEKQK